LGPVTNLGDTLVDAYGQQHQRAQSGARIVSLVPSITELLFDLDLGPQVVGRTGFCIHPRGGVRAVPKFGGTKDVDIEALLAAAPTHVIVNIDENTRETFEQLRACVPHVVVTHPNTPTDNLELFTLLGGIFAREAQSAALAADFNAALTDLRLAMARQPARRVLYLIWREPWMTVSPDTYIANMLSLLGWQTVPRVCEQRYPILNAGALRELQVDLCLLSSEPYPFRDKHMTEVSKLLGGTPVHLIDGEMVSWYGSRSIAGLRYLASYASDICASAA
jgi:ABC-type Fe3+-hydroxamate transport system substrate-binding protein